MFTDSLATECCSQFRPFHSTLNCWLYSLHRRISFSFFLIFLTAGITTAVTAQTLVPGQMVGWGYNFSGQAQLPIISPPLDNISAISSSDFFTAALRNDGTVVVWGQLAATVAPPQNLSDVTAIASSKFFLMALRRNGTVVFSGNFPQAGPFIPGYLVDVTAIAANTNHAMALKRDGTVIDWNVSDGSLIVVPPEAFGITAIAAGYPQSLALKNGGTVVAWGNSGFTVLDPPISLDNVVAITSSYYANFALRSDGSVFGWGISFAGLLEWASTLTNIKAISAHYSHALVIKANGTVEAGGDNLFGRAFVPTGITNVKAIEAGTYNSFAFNPVPLINPYIFSGFQPPVNTAPVVNIGKAGRTYPVKWQLKDQDGNFVSALTAVKSVSLASVLCGIFGAAPADAIEIETTGETMLRYDTETNQFIYNWKTPRDPLCYMLFFTLDTNQVLTAKFNLTK